MAREKNVSRSEARRRTRVAARAAGIPESEDDSLEIEETPDEPAQRSSLFRIPNVREDIASIPDMFRTRRLLWLPFVLLLASFVVALTLHFDETDNEFLALFVQMALFPQGLIVFLLAGFLAPRASYLVGFLLGVIDALLLLVLFGVVRGQETVASAGDQAPVGLAIFVGYAVVVGPLAAAFAAWYRSFLNRMGSQGRERRMAREAEQAKKRREEKRAAKRPASS